MSAFGKLQFWKKNNELGLNDELAMPKMPADEFHMENPSQMPGPLQREPQMEAYQESRPYQQYQQQSVNPNRDLELISAKLDALKATLDSINQRIASLERIAYGENDNQRSRGW